MEREADDGLGLGKVSSAASALGRRRGAVDAYCRRLTSRPSSVEATTLSATVAGETGRFVAKVNNMC